MQADALRKKPRRLGCTVHVQSLSELCSVFLSLYMLEEGWGAEQLASLPLSESLSLLSAKSTAWDLTGSAGLTCWRLRKPMIGLQSQ